MNEIIKENNVFFLTFAESYIAYYTKNDTDFKIIVLNESGIENVILEPVFRMFGLKNLLLFQNEEGSSLKVFQNSKIVNWLNKNHYINKIPNNVLIISEKNDNNYIDYVCLSNLNLIQVPFYPNYTDLNIIIDYWDRHTIKMQGLRNDNCWQTDISSYGKYLNSRDEQEPNEIDGDLMGFENLLFVPLRGGQLLALDVETGEKVWIQDYNNGRSGFYTLYSDKIYKHDGLSLLEIDACTGEKIREMLFPEYKVDDLKTFYALHYFWVYNDIIVLYGHKNRMIIIDRQSFQITDYIALSASLPASRDNVIWHDAKLYVLDLANTLHIFEAER